MVSLGGQGKYGQAYQATVVIKQFSKKSVYEKELYFYKNYSDFCPELVAYNDDTMTLVIEWCRPLMKTSKSISQALSVIDFLKKLHAAGANHNDTVSTNFVIKNGKPLLIDWEYASEDIGETSADVEDWWTVYDNALGEYYKDLDQTIIKKELK